jgi:hypothetical protein
VAKRAGRAPSNPASSRSEFARDVVKRREALSSHAEAFLDTTSCNFDTNELPAASRRIV